jgi:hypothetical protein
MKPTHIHLHYPDQSSADSAYRALCAAIRKNPAAASLVNHELARTHGIYALPAFHLSEAVAARTKLKTYIELARQLGLPAVELVVGDSEDRCIRRRRPRTRETETCSVSFNKTTLNLARKLAEIQEVSLSLLIDEALSRHLGNVRGALAKGGVQS